MVFWRANEGRDCSWQANPLKCSEVLAVLDLYGLRDQEDRMAVYSLVKAMDAEYLKLVLNRK